MLQTNAEPKTGAIVDVEPRTLNLKTISLTRLGEARHHGSLGYRV